MLWKWSFREREREMMMNWWVLMEWMEWNVLKAQVGTKKPFLFLLLLNVFLWLWTFSFHWLWLWCHFICVSLGWLGGDLLIDYDDGDDASWFKCDWWDWQLLLFYWEQGQGGGDGGGDCLCELKAERICKFCDTDAQLMAEEEVAVTLNSVLNEREGGREFLPFVVEWRRGRSGQFLIPPKIV